MEATNKGPLGRPVCVGFGPADRCERCERSSGKKWRRLLRAARRAPRPTPNAQRASIGHFRSTVAAHQRAAADWPARQLRNGLREARARRRRPGHRPDATSGRRASDGPVRSLSLKGVGASDWLAPGSRAAAPAREARRPTRRPVRQLEATRAANEDSARRESRPGQRANNCTGRHEINKQTNGRRQEVASSPTAATLPRSGCAVRPAKASWPANATGRQARERARLRARRAHRKPMRRRERGAP